MHHTWPAGDAGGAALAESGASVSTGLRAEAVRSGHGPPTQKHGPLTVSQRPGRGRFRRLCSGSTWVALAGRGRWCCMTRLRPQGRLAITITPSELRA